MREAAKDSTTRAFWTEAPAALFKELASNESGLTAGVVQDRLSKLPKVSEAEGKWRYVTLFLRQFNSPIIWILLGAAVMSIYLGDPTTAAIVFVIVFASGFLGFWQELHASDAVRKLLALVQISASVVRDGKTLQVPVSQVVPGDVFLLNAGSIVPADSVLIQSTDLFVNEATLTGESFPVEKKPGELPAETELGQRTNTVFQGTSVVSGTAKAIAINVGKDTEFGKVSESLRLRPPETEFEHGIRKFGAMLMEVTLLLVLAIFAINVYFHKPFIDALLFSLAIAVGLTPQLLPAIISVNLAQGAKRMADKKVIVKRLASIENFGSMDVLCTDKTGTLTDGTVKLNAAVGAGGKPSDKVRLFGYLNASFQTGYENPIDVAIVDAAKQDVSGYEKVREQPYDFTRKRLTIVLKKDGRAIAVTKGAVSNVLDVCSTIEKGDGTIVDIGPEVQGIQDQFEAASRQGFRAIGLAYRSFDDVPDGDCEQGMTFLGLLLFIDPLRPEIVKTLKDLADLGVSVKFVTGDNRYVAAEIVRQAGVADPKILSGPDMRAMSDEAFRATVSSVDVFAEVEPNQKARIIVYLQKAGHVVGHLGDGINDASAIHSADVGISVSNGVDVAKDAADIVLMEKDLGVLEDGIREGRITFANTLKYIFMATSANFGNMFSMAGASLFLKFLPMLPTQIMLTNFMQDFPEMTIASDSVDPEWIKMPRRWDIGFIKRFMVVFGLSSSIFDYVTFGVLLFILHANPDQFRTGWFLESVVTADLIVLVVRTRRPFFQSRPSRWLMATVLGSIAVVFCLPYIAPVAKLIGLVPLSPAFLLMVVLITALYVLVVETAKHFFYRNAR
jgi:Mg2+-importing ATPase